MTHTCATLAVDKTVFDDIWAKLFTAGYYHQLHESADKQKSIDMTGIALVITSDSQSTTKGNSK